MSFGSSKPPPPPTQTTTRQVPEYAPEQREYVSDIFGKAQELYEQRTEEGFQPFPGQQLAPFAAQEQEAFSGIESLARGPGAAPAFEVARTAALGAAAPVTVAEIQQGMNPYQQAVTDIAKREAVRQYQRGPQAQLRTGAVEAGGLRGSRRFIEEAEGQRNLQRRLDDLQTMGGQQAFQQAMAEAAASRGRLANLAAQMPSIGTGAYQQRMAQFGQLGGVGEAQRAREQAAIDLAQSQFQREQMFPEETLATYLRFITNAPSPSGFQRDVIAPGVRGPSAITQLGGLAGGLGTLAGGLGGKGGLLGMKSGGAVGRQAGLSGMVRRAGGGQIVRMQQGRQVRDYPGVPGLVLPIEDVPVTPFQTDVERVARSIEEFMPDTSSNIAKGLARAEPKSDKISAYFRGTEEEFQDAQERAAETERMIEAAKAAGMGFDEYIRDYENSGFAPSEQIEKMTPSKPKEETVIEEETPPAPDIEPQEKQQTLAERYAAYRKLMEGDDTESKLSLPERLQIASAFFSAADTPGTGSFLGDLTQFGAKVTPGVAKGLAARDARELAAKKRRIQSVKDFRKFIKEEQLRPLEIAKLAADLGYTQAQTNKLVSEYTNPEVASPSEVDITGAISYLDRTGIPVLETSKEKGKYGKAGSAYQLAQVAKSLKTSADHALRIAQERGAVAQDPDGRLIIDVDKAIRGGSRRVDQPVRGVTRGADGKLVAKAEGGMVGEKPVLRYPEDFS
jgi:hypothetical protein